MDKERNRNIKQIGIEFGEDIVRIQKAGSRVCIRIGDTMTNSSGRRVNPIKGIEVESSSLVKEEVKE